MVLWTAVCLLAVLPAMAAERVALLVDRQVEGPAAYGLGKLQAGLEAKGYSVDRRTDGRAAGARWAVVASVKKGAAESLRVRRTKLQGVAALAIEGGDGTGLMYAALEVAGRVAAPAAGAAPWREVEDTAETPFLAERGLSIYTMQRAWFESRLYDENHWRRYFDLMAESRLNTFTVIFGYENGGFLAPVYPYFFDVDGFAGVRMVGLTRAQQERNTAAFRAMMRIAHERGVRVIAAIWDHIYRGGVQGGGIAGASELAGREVPGLVHGVTAENLSAYTKAALRRFLATFPELDGVEFRMHDESGLRRDEMAGFWHEVFGILAQAKPGMLVTLRAKELPDAVIDDALAQGLRARIETKYWMEQMGLPFHPTHINRQNQRERRHGYADLLRYPQRYKVHWRLWSGGTARLLLWADPEYVRRFAESARLYGGESFDVNEMLATKMLGDPHERAPLAIHAPSWRHYDYEFERYWHFFQVWGRVSYNPAAAADVGKREFAQRFGAAGPALRRGLHRASQVLPRIVAASYRYQLFPTTRGWAEMMREEDLPKYADLEGTDIEQFQSPREAAKALLAGTATSKRTPEETSRWLEATADAVESDVKAAEAAGAPGKEAVATIVDLRILAGLARFHGERLRAAVRYNLYRESGSVAAFDAAMARERAAVEAWAGMVRAAGDVYAPELSFGVHRVGFPRHWSEELERLRVGLAALEAERMKARTSPAAAFAPPATGAPPVVRLEAPGKATPGKPLRVVVHAAAPADVRSLQLRYRHVTQVEDYRTVEMKAAAGGRFVAEIPGDFIETRWDVMYFVEAIGRNGAGRNYPDLDVAAPYVMVPVVR